MSADAVDDLWFAEESLSQLAEAAAGAIASGDGDQALAVLGTVRAVTNAYCRPTCQFMDEGECASGDDTCGCLCGHTA